MKLSRTIKERLAAAALIAVAVVLLLMGALRTHKIYDPVTEEFGIVAFQRISERELVEDATFGGVRLDKGQLYTTYDRTQPRGKRTCPT